MKNLITLVFLCFTLITHAQDSITVPDVFIRVYNLDGNKIAKGKILGFTENNLIISHNGLAKEISTTLIGMIKTKHSAGNNLLIGASSGLLVGTIAASTEKEEEGEWNLFSKEQTMVFGAFSGMVAGSAIGGISILFKKSETFIINGEIENWKRFTTTLLSTN